MPDEPDPTFGLDAFAQLLPQDKTTVFWEYNFSSVDFGPFVQAFHEFSEARDREDEARRQARLEADAAYEAMERQENGGGGER